jgi:MraZ protein
MASPSENSKRTFYSGVFRHGVDAKRRVQIPSKWRPEQADTELVLIPWRDGSQQDANILVLPPHQVEALWEKVSKMSMTDPTAQSLRRLIGNSASSVTLDSAGRICLPEELVKRVQIGDEVVLSGLVDRFEIWNPARYDVARSRDQALQDQAINLI